MCCDEIYLEADNVLATLYAAKKYIVPHLARACVNYLETSLTAKNACLLLSQSRLFEEPELMQRCWEVIDAQVCDTIDRMHLEQIVHGNCSDGDHDGGGGVDAAVDSENSTDHALVVDIAPNSAFMELRAATVDSEQATGLVPMAIMN